MRKMNWVVGLSMASAAALAVLQACSSDDAPAPAATPDASTGPVGNPDGSGPGPSDAGPGSDAPTGSKVTFTVPAAGGSVDVSGKATKLTFTFPASAGGKTITLEPKSATDIGWPDGQFAEVIQMGPSGTRFDQPVLVKPEKKELVSAVLSFSGDGPAKGAASVLPLAANGEAFELRHFSSLVIVGPGRLCDSETSNDTPDAAYCAAEGTRTTQRRITCAGNSYCVNVSLLCCIDPAVDAGPGCTWADTRLSSTQTPTGSSGGQYPYCEGDAGDWDGGASNCGAPLLYSWRAFPGCTTWRPECQGMPPGAYYLECDGGTCQCFTQFNNRVDGPSFPQGATCDNAANMRTEFVKKCNYPAAL